MSNELEQLKFNFILGFRNMQEKLEKNQNTISVHFEQKMLRMKLDLAAKMYY